MKFRDYSAWGGKTQLRSQRWVRTSHDNGVPAQGCDSRAPWMDLCVPWHEWYEPTGQEAEQLRNFMPVLERCKRSMGLGLLTVFLVLVMGFFSPVRAGERFEEFKARTKARFPDISWINVATLDQWLKNKKGPELLLLDTRSREEFDVSHIETAQVASTLDEAMLLLAGRPKEQLVVTYCSVGYRSAITAAELGKAGFRNVHNLEGSLFEWANKGHPIYRNGQRVREVHFYNFWWGMYLKKELWAW